MTNAYLDQNGNYFEADFEVPGATPTAKREPSLAALKAAKHAQIERERDAECYADVVALGVPWQADARSQQMLASAILLAQDGVYTPSVWRNSNNTNIPVTLADLVVLAGTMAAQTQAAYARSWTRKAALAAATTVEVVEAV